MADPREDALQKLNLNLVPVLRALLRDGSVSGAAITLGRSPSAVSEALSQLRIVFDDQLLVRVGRSLRLTPRASQLAGPLEDLYERLEGFFRKDTFDPARSKRSFTIASPDLFVHILGGALVQTVHQHAPYMSLNFIDIGTGITEKMAAREIDFVLLPEFAIADLAPAPIRFRALAHGASIALMSREHPLANRVSVSKEDLRGYRHVRFRPDPVLLAGHKRPYENVGQPFDVAISVRHFLTIPRLLEGTNLVAVVPRSIVPSSFEGLPLVAVELAFETISTRSGIAWSPVYDRDEAHSWFRSMIADLPGQNITDPISSPAI